MNQSVPRELKSVIREYGWGKPYRMTRNKNAWYISSPQGKYFLKKTNISSDRLKFLQQILTKIRNEGYQELLPFIHTRKLESLVSHAQGRWYATPWKQTQNSKRDVKDLVVSLARFHRFAEPFVKEVSDRYQVDSQWIQRCRENKELTTQFKQKVSKKEFPSPFDHTFAKYHPVLDQSLNFVIQGMDKFMKSEAGKPPRYTLCHNRIHSSNIVYDDKGFYWVDFDHAIIDSPVRDLAMFIRRFANQENSADLLEWYEREFPLRPKEKRLLALYLAYPEKILKEVKNYYHGVHVSTEPSLQKKLEKEAQKLINVQQLVVELWPVQKKRTR